MKTLIQHLGGWRLRSNEEVEMAAREWLLIQLPDFCLDGIFELVPEFDICITVLCDYDKHNDRLVDQVRHVERCNEFSF